jgi:hypothetical protein
MVLFLAKALNINEGEFREVLARKVISKVGED